ncbi:hypothetical protein ACJMK2_013048 [Sinanodonta woodiana]|uniref:Lysozyme n=1 Tax=Sinanodonta woodiana TaxID=1069815 RepID=A0ABD3VCF0_SINWO
MKLQSILQGVVLVSVLLLTISVNAKNATRRRKFRCEKYLGAVNKAVDTKLKEFEEMFSKFLEPMSDNYKKESAKLPDISVKLGEIIANMRISQEEIRREKYNLQLVLEHMYSQKPSANSLNSNFKALDGILTYLSLLVDQLVKMTDVGESGLISGDTSAMKHATAATKTTIKTTGTTATTVESTTTLTSIQAEKPQYPRDPDFLDQLRQELINDEGYKHAIYNDTTRNATFGIGHKITIQDPEFSKPFGTKVSKERIEEAYRADVKAAIKSCCILFKDFQNLPNEVQLIILNMRFNLGHTGLASFKKFRKAINNRNWVKAAREMEQSIWYKQVPKRAKRLTKRMRKVRKKC